MEMALYKNKVIIIIIIIIIINIYRQKDEIKRLCLPSRPTLYYTV